MSELQNTTRAIAGQRMTIAILGLGFGGRRAGVLEGVLAQEPGVTYAYVNPNTEMAYVIYDPCLFGPETLVAVVERAGFQVEPLERHAFPAIHSDDIVALK